MTSAVPEAVFTAGTAFFKAYHAALVERTASASVEDASTADAADEKKPSTFCLAPAVLAAATELRTAVAAKDADAVQSIVATADVGRALAHTDLIVTAMADANADDAVLRVPDAPAAESDEAALPTPVAPDVVKTETVDRLWYVDAICMAWLFGPDGARAPAPAAQDPSFRAVASVCTSHGADAGHRVLTHLAGPKAGPAFVEAYTKAAAAQEASTQSDLGFFLPSPGQAGSPHMSLIELFETGLHAATRAKAISCGTAVSEYSAAIHPQRLVMIMLDVAAASSHVVEAAPVDRLGVFGRELLMSVLTFGPTAATLRSIDEDAAAITALVGRDVTGPKAAAEAQSAGNNASAVDRAHSVSYAYLMGALRHRWRIAEAAARSAAGDQRATMLASAGLHGELLLLARLVQVRLLPLTAAWALFNTEFPQVDAVAADFYSNVAQYTADLRQHAESACVEVISNPAAFDPSKIGTSQVIGDNFSLLKFGVPRPVWGTTFKVEQGHSFVFSAIHFTCALVRVAAFDDALSVLRSARDGALSVGTDADAAVGTATVGPMDLLCCPNAATTWGSLPSVICTAAASWLGRDAAPLIGSAAASTGSPAPQASKETTAASMSTAPAPTAVELGQGLIHLAAKRRRWEAAWPLLRDVRSYLSSSPFLGRCVGFLAAARNLAASIAPHVDGTCPEVHFWAGAIAAFVRELLSPCLRVMPPSPALSRTTAVLLALLPHEEQFRVMLDIAKPLSVKPHPHDVVEELRQRTLLNTALGRVSASTAKQYGQILMPALYADPMAVVDRLVRRSVGYSDPEMLNAYAMLVRDAPPLFFTCFPILALERARMAADDGGPMAQQRVTSIATLLAIVWRHNWYDIDAGFVLQFVGAVLRDESRNALVFGLTFLKALFAHVASWTPDNELQLDATQRVSLAAGRLGQRYGAGTAQALMSKWTASATPRTALRNARLLTAALVDPANHGIGVQLWHHLGGLRARLTELYRDLPGSVNDVMMILDQDSDLAHGLGTTVFEQCLLPALATTGPAPDLRFLFELYSLARSVVPAAALLQCVERITARKALFDAAQSSSAAPAHSARHPKRGRDFKGDKRDDKKDDGKKGEAGKDKAAPAAEAAKEERKPLSAEQADTVLRSLFTAFAGTASMSRPMGTLDAALGPNGSFTPFHSLCGALPMDHHRTRALYALFWVLDLKEVTDPAPAYANAAEVHRKMLEMGKQKLAAAGRKGKLECEDDTNSLAAEAATVQDRYQAMRQVITAAMAALAPEAPASLPATAATALEAITAEDEKARATAATAETPWSDDDEDDDDGDEATGACDIGDQPWDALGLVQHCLVPRAKHSQADAMYVPAFLRACWAANRALSRPLLDCAMTFITTVVASFVGLSNAETLRLGTALRGVFEFILDVTAAEAGAANEYGWLHPWRLLEAQVEGFLVESFFDLLTSTDVSPAITRNAFGVLDKLRSPKFPVTAVGARVLRSAVQIHAVDTSPHYAAASAVSHSLKIFVGRRGAMLLTVGPTHADAVVETMVGKQLVRCVAKMREELDAKNAAAEALLAEKKAAEEAEESEEESDEENDDDAASPENVEDTNADAEEDNASPHDEDAAADGRTSFDAASPSGEPAPHADDDAPADAEHDTGDAMSPIDGQDRAPSADAEEADANNASAPAEEAAEAPAPEAPEDDEPAMKAARMEE